VFATSGQRCTSAGRIIVANRIKRTLIKKLLQEALKLKVGNGYDLDTDMGPIINKERLSKINKDVITAIKNGAKLICGGKIATEDELHKGNFFEPTLLSNVSPEMEIAQKETFGPVAVILPFKNEKEALEIANNIPYGLTAAIFTKNINKAMHFSHNVEVGSFFVNTACVGAEINIPFGGLKASGNGFREGAHHMLDIYTEWKSLSIQY
ncbi:MAG: aldehyde dehydrogenase family protein, partial [Bacteroidales bacterium]|nr:aldehyde dehydrogenase family protein [Bacteroidales bacterium]